MTAADKLRELLATRPAMPNTEELVRWWRFGGEAVTELLAGFPATARAIVALEVARADRGDEIERLRAELQALDCDLVATRAELRRERDERAYLRVELDRERIQHTADNEASASALAQEAHEKAILEQVNSGLRAVLDAAKRWRDYGNTPVWEGELRAAVDAARGMEDGGDSAPPRVDDKSRCAVCGWPLEQEVRRGCVRGNCSQRPRPTNLYAPERAAGESVVPDAERSIVTSGARPLCLNNSPPWFSGRWRDWHRGHGCDKDDGRPRTAEGAIEIERGGR